MHLLPCCQRLQMGFFSSRGAGFACLLVCYRPLAHGNFYPFIVVIVRAYAHIDTICDARYNISAVGAERLIVTSRRLRAKLA